MKVGIIGAGSWGIALANVLADNSVDVSIYIRDKKQYEYILENKRSYKYLKDFIFPDEIKLNQNLEEVVRSSEVVVLATPFQIMDTVLESIKNFLKPETILVNVSKGMHMENYKTGQYFANKICPENKYVVLSGPSHAEEVSKRMVTTVVSCSKDIIVAEKIQDLFMNDYFRVYIHTDVMGVEVAGALKNVIAIGSGIIKGVNQGDNARAALITRGLFEISKLGKKLGCNLITFTGLAGVGDLIVTSTSIHSRNFRAGILIGQGVNINEIEKEVGETVEGLKTVKAAYELSKIHNVDMPITQAIYEGIYEGKNIRKAILELMTRGKKHEFLEEMELNEYGRE